MTDTTPLPPPTAKEPFYTAARLVSSRCYCLKIGTHWWAEVFLQIDDNKSWLEGHQRTDGRCRSHVFYGTWSYLFDEFKNLM